MGLNTGTPKNINFLFGIYGISMILSVSILKHFRVLGQIGLSKQCRAKSDILKEQCDQGLHCLPFHVDHSDASLHCKSNLFHFRTITVIISALRGAYRMVPISFKFHRQPLASRKREKDSLYISSRLHDPDGPHAHIW